MSLFRNNRSRFTAIPIRFPNQTFELSKLVVVIYLPFPYLLNLLTKFLTICECWRLRSCTFPTTMIISLLALTPSFEPDKTLTEIDLLYQIRTLRHCSHSTITFLLLLLSFSPPSYLHSRSSRIQPQQHRHSQTRSKQLCTRNSAALLALSSPACPQLISTASKRWPKRELSM